MKSQDCQVKGLEFDSKARTDFLNIVCALEINNTAKWVFFLNLQQNDSLIVMYLLKPYISLWTKF